MPGQQTYNIMGHILWNTYSYNQDGFPHKNYQVMRVYSHPYFFISVLHVRTCMLKCGKKLKLTKNIQNPPDGYERTLLHVQKKQNTLTSTMSTLYFINDTYI